MFYQRKLRAGYDYKGFIPILIIFPLFFFAAVFINIQAGLIVLFLAFFSLALYSLLSYIKTRSIAYIPQSLMQFFFSMFFLTVPHGPLSLGDIKKAYMFYLLGFFIGIWALFLVFQRKAKWKGREVFELAAMAVDETVNGFTERPRPAGKLEYTKSELFGFAEFLKRNLVIVTYVEQNRIVLVPVKNGDEYPFMFGLEGDYNFRTWIAFDFEGNVSVSISRKDYLDFKEELSFDLLCDSMGKLFADFLAYYKKGEEQRILYHLNKLKLSILS